MGGCHCGCMDRTDRFGNRELCDLATRHFEEQEDDCANYDQPPDDLDCTFCCGDGECDANANPMWDCDDQPHPCHACDGSGRRSDQRVF